MFFSLCCDVVDGARLALKTINKPQKRKTETISDIERDQPVCWALSTPIRERLKKKKKKSAFLTGLHGY